MAQTVKNDAILFRTVLVLAAVGVLMLVSASSAVASVRYGNTWHFVLRQLGWGVFAVGAMMFLKRRDYRNWNKEPLVYGSISFVLMLLMLVYVLDPRTHRWFRLGPLNLQPSEFAKPVLILFLAHFVARRAQAINRKHTLLCAAAIVGLVAGIVMVADLGTAVVIAVTASVVFWVAGVERRYFFVAGAVALVFVCLAIASKPYRIARIAGYIDPEYKTLDTSLVRYFDREGRLKAKLQLAAPTRDSNYHINQSLIAVGSGGPLGVGPMRSKAKLLYLPEAHTDFIYAVISEELGLWGSLMFTAGFLVIFWRGLRIHFRARDDFGRFLALGVTTMVAVQAFMNISVVLGIVPPKGIPLPLVSYGGSSLLTTMASLGLLQSVGDHSG